MKCNIFILYTNNSSHVKLNGRYKHKERSKTQHLTESPL